MHALQEMDFTQVDLTLLFCVCVEIYLDSIDNLAPSLFVK
jgi:hypothetical protein